MGKLSRHWTDTSTDDFLYRVGADFVQQIEEVMESPQTNQATLAKTLGVTEGRVSQILNRPGNLTLRNVIEYARALQKKVALVVYDDNDPLNQNGPINPQVFARCWERANKPSDFFELDEFISHSMTATNSGDEVLEETTFPYVIHQRYGSNQVFRWSGAPGPLLETETGVTKEYREAAHGRVEANSI